MGHVWRRRLAAVAVGTAMGCFGTYVFANLLVVNLVPCLHTVTLTINVVDRETSAPIPGATVEWARASYTASERIGLTGSGGELQFSETVQENPWWAWPKVGSFRFVNRVLRVQAPSFQTQEVRLSEALPDLPYSNPVARLRIPLRRE